MILERVRSSPYYPALSHPAGALAQVLAARSSLLIVAAPIGTALAGPLVAAVGARGTLLVSALGTIALALITAAWWRADRRGSEAGRLAGNRVRGRAWPGC